MNKLNVLPTNYFRILNSGLFIMLTVLLSACATVGKDFPVNEVSNISIGKTTQKELLVMFGSPWRTGIEDKHKTWTYGKYYYSLFSQEKATDLVIKFDNNNVVISYTYSTSEHNE